jgi:hypothetical protein
MLVILDEFKKSHKVTHNFSYTQARAHFFQKSAVLLQKMAFFQH